MLSERFNTAVVCPACDCCVINRGSNNSSRVLVVEAHPDGRLSSMRLLQAEDLRHHVVGGGMQQDPARGQADHHVAAHRRQTDRDSIWTC